MTIARRLFLGALALAPAALAACAGEKGARRDDAAAAGSPHGSAGAPDAGLAQMRDFPLPADAAPAFVFRAAAVRPGER